MRLFKRLFRLALAATVVGSALQTPYRRLPKRLAIRSGGDRPRPPSSSSSSSSDDSHGEGHIEYPFSVPWPSAGPHVKTHPLAQDQAIFLWSHLLTGACRACMLARVRDLAAPASPASPASSTSGPALSAAALWRARFCPRTCTSRVQADFGPGQAVRDRDGDPVVVPGDLAFLVHGWSCDRTLVERAVGRIPDPAPDEAGPEEEEEEEEGPSRAFRLWSGAPQRSLTRMEASRPPPAVAARAGPASGCAAFGSGRNRLLSPLARLCSWKDASLLKNAVRPRRVAAVAALGGRRRLDTLAALRRMIAPLQKEGMVLEMVH
ncbi:MAG: hypothetical protein M1826_003348 [Phylliscum demangeonii]|nr:MAG: hypothetical protein M1826_003348 [Phylliscum demangeonii]